MTPTDKAPKPGSDEAYLGDFIPWGVERTPDMLWIGPMRPDGHKVAEIVCTIETDPTYSQDAMRRRDDHARLIAAAPWLKFALAAEQGYARNLATVRDEQRAEIATLRASNAKLREALREAALCQCVTDQQRQKWDAALKETE